MSFPLNPTDGAVYTNNSGISYTFVSADNKWITINQNLGVTGAQGLTGLKGDQGFTGAQGVTGIAGGYTGILNVIINNNDRYLTPGQKCEVRMPFDYTINNWYAFCSPTGYCSAILYKTTFDAYPSFSAMNGVTGMWITNGVKNRETGVNWSNRTGAKDDILRFVIDSSTGIQTLNVSIGYNKI